MGADQWKYFSDKPNGCIDIWWMCKARDEQDVCPRRRRRSISEVTEHIRNYRGYRDIRRKFGDNVAFLVGQV